MKKIIDLRSDTLTVPTKEMREFMMNAEVGDDVFGEDPTVNQLQKKVADLLGKEAALFVASGTMGNQTCINGLTRPGDEVICDREAHIFNYESSSVARLSGIQIYPLDGKLGVLNPDQVVPYIRTTAYHMPRTKVIEVENTHNRRGGTIWQFDDIISLKNLAKKNNLFYRTLLYMLIKVIRRLDLLIEKYSKIPTLVYVLKIEELVHHAGTR